MDGRSPPMNVLAVTCDSSHMATGRPWLNWRCQCQCAKCGPTHLCKPIPGASRLCGDRRDRLESVDNRDSIHLLSIPTGVRFSEEFSEELPGGLMTISTDAVSAPYRIGGLYFSSDQKPPRRPAAITAIPYYANANRGPVEMAVWIPVDV